MSLQFRASMFACGLAAAMGILFAGASAWAQTTYTWNDTGTTWNTTANWTPIRARAQRIRAAPISPSL